MVDEEDWEEILSMSKPVRGYKASTRSKNKDSAQVSDSDDEDYNPSTKNKPIPKIKKKVRGTLIALNHNQTLMLDLFKMFSVIGKYCSESG